jgi:exodeoxyribonuclease VII small subunit
MLTNQAPLDFEASLSELESLVGKMETDQLTLEEALACFEKGVALTSYCQKALKAAELKVESIVNQGLPERLSVQD